MPGSKIRKLALEKLGDPGAGHGFFMAHFPLGLFSSLAVVRTIKYMLYLSWLLELCSPSETHIPSLSQPMDQSRLSSGALSGTSSPTWSSSQGSTWHTFFCLTSRHLPDHILCAEPCLPVLVPHWAGCRLAGSYQASRKSTWDRLEWPLDSLKLWHSSERLFQSKKWELKATVKGAKEALRACEL